MTEPKVKPAKADESTELDAGTEGPSNLARHKVNRGSQRRIARAVDRLETDLDAFLRELDVQIFEADEKGERVGSWPWLDRVRAFRADARQAVADAVAATDRK